MPLAEKNGKTWEEERLRAISLYHRTGVGPTGTWAVAEVQVAEVQQLGLADHTEDSAPFFAAGHHWRTRIKFTRQEGFPVLGLFLWARSLAAGGTGPHVRFSLTLVNRVNLSLSIRKDTEHTFTDEEDDWGFIEFAKPAVDPTQFAPDGYFHIKVDFFEFSPTVATVVRTKTHDLIPHNTADLVGGDKEQLQHSVLILDGNQIRMVSRCPKGAPRISAFLAEARYFTSKMLGQIPEMFDCVVSLVGGAIEVTVHIKDQIILQQLPFLADLIKTTTPSDVDMRGRTSPAELFGDCIAPPSLAPETLQMARFMCSTELEGRVTAWLQHAAQCFAQSSSTNFSKNNGLQVDPETCMHYSEVLQLLPDDCAATVATDLFNDQPLCAFITSAFSWPTSLLRGWLHTLTSLDLRGVPVPLGDTCKLLSQLQHNNCMQELHVDLSAGRTSSSVPVQAQAASSSNANTETGNGNQLECSSHIQSFLMTLEAAAPHLNRQLRVLGIHGLANLSTQHCMQLSRVCTCLASSVTGFAVTFAADIDSNMKETALPQNERKLLFKAISRLSKLSVLAVPQWKLLVGSDASAAAPLRSMPCLKFVLVNDVVEGPGFNVEGLNFELLKVCESRSA